MKTMLLCNLACLLSLAAISQNQKKIQKSWIKTNTETLSGQVLKPDTLYCRYSFDKSKLYISFYPAWDDFTMDWSVKGDNLTIGQDAYHIDELTDSSLVISLAGFRRFTFLSEDHLARLEENLPRVGSYHDKPLYLANKVITPRYTKRTSLSNLVQKNLGAYHIKTAAYFLATFIVTEEGKLENVQIVQGITEGFNKDVTERLLKTSKDWKPAYYQGHPVQTQMSFDIKYLDSKSVINSMRKH